MTLIEAGERQPAGRDAFEESGHALIELQRVSKSFGNVLALQNITTSVHANEVTCVLGDNGAGKSTFIKILSGVHPHDSGNFLMEGRDVHFHSPRDAQGRRHRHRLPGPGDGAADVDLAQLLPRLRADPCGFGSIDIPKAKTRRRRGDGQDGHRRARPRPAGRHACRAASASRVAIARAVYFGAKVLILDEPTAALGVPPVGRGAAVHRRRARPRARRDLHHPQPASRATRSVSASSILKRGQSLGNFAKSEISREELIQLMAGGAELEALAHEIESVARPKT